MFFWLGLISYNHYLEIHSNNLIVEIRHKDSLRNNISRYNLTIAHQKDIIFNQYGLIKGGVLDDTLPDVLPPIPKRLKILEPIGVSKRDVFKEYGGRQIPYSSVYLSYNKKDPLGIETGSNNALGNTILIDKKKFYDSLKTSPKFLQSVYDELKAAYDDSTCPNIYSFERMIGQSQSFVLYQKQAIIYKEEIDRISKERNDISNEATGAHTWLMTKYFLFIILCILFVFRYIYLLLKWCIMVIKK